MYNIGIVGSSFIATEFIKSARSFEELNVLALYSRTEEKGVKFSQENNIQMLYTNYEEMLSSKEIDIIYIASPNFLHYEQSLKAIENKKHVIVEKPATLLLTELEDLYRKAKVNNVIIMEAIVNIHYNTFKRTKELISKIGSIHYANFTLQQQTRHYKDYIDGNHINVFSNKMGGGALRDLGPYILYPMVYFFGEPLKVEYYPINNLESVDESVTLMCSYKDFYVSLSTSKLVADKRENIISGTNGYITIDHINYFTKIRLFDIKGTLLEEVTSTYINRMDEQIKYFLDKLNSNTNIDDEFINNSLIVNKLIENKYLS